MNMDPGNDRMNSVLHQLLDRDLVAVEMLCERVEKHLEAMTATDLHPCRFVAAVISSSRITHFLFAGVLSNDHGVVEAVVSETGM